jgi:glycosyltransferase involved in cell wall biosynthesis
VIVRVLYLTDNPTLGGTIRILQSWLVLGRRNGTVAGHVVIPVGSSFRQWLEANSVPFTSSRFPVPSKRWPWPALVQAFRVRRWAKQHSIDLIHCNEHNIYPFAALLRRFTGLPLICHVRYQIGREYAQWAFGGRSRQPDALLWTSRQQQEDCAEAIRGVVPSDKQHLVPLGVDPSVFGSRLHDRQSMRHRWGVGDDDVVIGQACALRPRKRIEEFIDLVATLVREGLPVVGVLAGDAMAGDEPYRDEIVKHLERQQLGSRFQWLGNVDDVEPFDQAIDIFVSTSDYETFGNSVCEAMACGRPVVGYRGGSIHEVVGDGGTIVADRDFAGLVAATRDCVVHADTRRELGASAKQRVIDCFSPAATLEQLTGIYSALTSR